MSAILYTSKHIPPEWIEAHGFKAMRIMPQENYKAPIETTEGSCDFMRAFFNSAYHTPHSGIIAASVCDQMRRGFDLFSGKTDSPLFLFNQPALWQRSSSLKLYIAELKRMSLFLQSLGGVAPSQATLKNAMIQEEAKRVEYKRRFQEQRFLESYYNAPQEESLTNNCFKIALLGGPITEGQRSTIEIIEKAGGNIVFDESESSLDTMPVLYNKRELREEPFLHMAETWFTSNHSIYQRPNTLFYQNLQEKIELHKPQGLILFRWIWCDFWHGESTRISDFVSIPTVIIDSNENDATSRNQTRIEAFIELIQSAKVLI